jgi:hypothetical protein
MERLDRIGPGFIARRQATFCDLDLDDGRCLRVHFIDKLESRLKAERFFTVRLVDQHPLLVEYTDQWVELSFKGVPTDPDRIVAGIEDAVADASHGWRSAHLYLNTSIAPVHLLQTDGGIIWVGPDVHALNVQPVLEAGGLSVQRFNLGRRPKSCKVALFGQSYVVARDFRVDPIDT